MPSCVLATICRKWEVHGIHCILKLDFKLIKNAVEIIFLRVSISYIKRWENIYLIHATCCKNTFNFSSLKIKIISNHCAILEDVMLQKVRGFIEKFYPSEPISFHPSRIKALFVLLIVLFLALFFYLRSTNKQEINFLELRHNEIQMSVKNYLNTMSRVSYNKNKMKELKIGLDKSKRELSKIEEKIDSIKNFWFLD